MWHGFQALATPKATGLTRELSPARLAAVGARNYVQTSPPNRDRARRYKRAARSAPHRPAGHRATKYQRYVATTHYGTRSHVRSVNVAKTSSATRAVTRRGVGLREWRLGFGRRSSRHMDQDLVLSVPSTR